MVWPMTAADDSTPVSPFRALLNLLRDYLFGSDSAVVPAADGGSAAGFTGTVTVTRVGNTVTWSGTLAGTPVNTSGIAFVLPPRFRPRNSCKVLVGASGTTNLNVRLLAVSASTGEVQLLWSGAFGSTTAGTGGASLHATGVSYQAAPA